MRIEIRRQGSEARATEQAAFDREVLERLAAAALKHAPIELTDRDIEAARNGQLVIQRDLSKTGMPVTITAMPPSAGPTILEFDEMVLVEPASEPPDAERMTGGASIRCSIHGERLYIDRRHEYRPGVGPSMTRQLDVQPCGKCLENAVQDERERREELRQVTLRVRDRVAQLEAHINNDPGEPVPPWPESEATFEPTNPRTCNLVFNAEPDAVDLRGRHIGQADELRARAEPERQADLTEQELSELAGLAGANVNGSAHPCDVTISALADRLIAEVRRRRESS